MRYASILLLASAVHAMADTTAPDFGRYQIIIDRMPFGSLPAATPAGGDAAANQPPKPSFAEQLRLSMIIEEENGEKRIGFVHKGTNKSHVMGLGDEPQDGITLVSADFEKLEAVLKKDDEEVVMKLSSGEVTSRGSTSGRPAPAAPGIRPTTGMNVPPMPPSYADRRRMRTMTQNPADVAPSEQPKYTGEELQKHLNQYKLDVIRQGLPALPIPLTAEEDAQLVNEGVLPPQ